MKRKHLLFLSLLLSQTAPVWSMWNADDENAMTTAGNGQARLNVQFLDFIPSLPPGVPNLAPSDPLPQNWGTAKQRVQCTFTNNATANVTLPTEYPLQGQWLFQEDRDNTQEIATLKLTTLLNNQRRVEAYQRQVFLPHTLTDPGVEVPEGYYFNGITVYQVRTKQQQWLNPRNQQHYTRTLSIRDGEIPSHKDYQIIYVEPFALADEPPRANNDAYQGEYHFLRDLAEYEELPGKKIENLIYSDGNHIYLPHITQELWRQGHSQVGFFIASYKQDRKLNFVNQAQIPHGQLPEGLYQLTSVEEQPNRRLERWQKLEDDPQQNNIFEIMCPAGVASIAGMGGFASRIVSNDQSILEALVLQKKIEDIIQKTENAAALHPNPTGSVIVLGPTGSGKTTFIHGLAGDLHAEEDQDGYLRLHADQPLPGFNIGHNAVVGTMVPNLWYDQTNNIFYWDCPGFGDPRGLQEDIINAFAIDTLFQNSAVKVVLAASDFALDLRNQRGRHFFDLLNEITKLFTDETQLQNALTLLVTQGGNPQPSARLNALLREAQQGGQNLNLTPSANNLLSFLQANTIRVTSMPQPQQDGAYSFNQQPVLNCLSRAQYVPNPSVDFKAGVQPGAKLLVMDLAQGLNQYLSRYMETEGAQRLINYCRQRIDAYSGPVTTLRTEFQQLKRTLKTLPNVLPTTPMDVVNILNPYMDTKDISHTINLLGFFKRLENNITFSVTEWSTKLLEAVKAKIKFLTATPQVEYTNNILNLKGILVGTSDIEEALRVHPNSTQINAYSLNTLFVDEDITAHGVSVSFLAPQWKVIRARNINLSGKDGVNGANGLYNSYMCYSYSHKGKYSKSDGQPGQAGGNGGHFYGKGLFFDHWNQLTTNTNGGTGGNGGNGGNGSNGEDGDSGGCSHDAGYQQGGRGYDAGRGGIKGTGGYCGVSILEGNQWNIHPHSGQDGSHGNPGIPGKGGKHYYAQNEYASSGYQPSSSDLNTSGQQQPAAPTDFDAVPIVQAYKDYYEQQAVNVNICPFIKVFPNLQ